MDVKATNVLDVGGAQGGVRDRVRSWNVGTYEVADIEQPADLILDLNTATVFPLGKYDLIFCLEVFDYIWNPSHALYVLRQMTNNKIIVTFPFIYPHHNELDRDALRYTEPGVKRLAEAAGLRVTNVWYRRDKSGLLKQFYAADGMRAAKEYPDHSVTGFVVEFTK